MGRFAQAQRRGSSSPELFPVLPPVPDGWSLASGSPGIVTVDLAAPFPDGVSSINVQWWQFTPVAIGPFTDEALDSVPADFESDAESGATQRVRIQYADDHGNPLSDWSGTKDITVA
jgi:hypothetical protein